VVGDHVRHLVREEDLTMPVPFVTCKNKVTGAVTEIPETALPHMTDWVPVDQGPGEDEPKADQADEAWSKPADDDAPAQQAISSPDPVAPEPPAPSAETDQGAAVRPAKRKAADSALTSEEK
jgi:hypothetical protein